MFPAGVKVDRAGLERDAGDLEDLRERDEAMRVATTALVMSDRQLGRRACNRRRLVLGER